MRLLMTSVLLFTSLLFTGLFFASQVASDPLTDKWDREYEEEQARKKLQRKFTAAIRSGNMYAARQAVREGASILFLDKDLGNGYTILHDVSRYNSNLKAIDILIELGANVNAQDKYQQTPLHKGSRDSSHPKMIETLLKHGADPNI